MLWRHLAGADIGAARSGDLDRAARPAKFADLRRLPSGFSLRWCNFANFRPTFYLWILPCGLSDWGRAKVFTPLSPYKHLGSLQNGGPLPLGAAILASYTLRIRRCRAARPGLFGSTMGRSSSRRRSTAGPTRMASRWTSAVRASRRTMRSWNRSAACGMNA